LYERKRQPSDFTKACFAEATTAAGTAQSSVRLGLKENWRQFALLLLVNAFVGGVVGLERTVVPLIGSEEFGLASTTVIASFIASFGISKAITNLVSDQLADGWGRKWVLVIREWTDSGPSYLHIHHRDDEGWCRFAFNSEIGRVG
jgi:hypothetical protein